LPRGTILIDRQLSGIKAGQPVFGPVKDIKNWLRTIQLGDLTLGVLAEHVCCYGLGPQGLVFTLARGGPMWRSEFSRAWTPVPGSLGVPVGDGNHQLKRFYASALIRAGESVKVVQERLGHASAAMTLDVYSHIWPEVDDRTRAATDRVLGPLVSPACHDEQAAE
jgi:integrase